MDGGIFFAEVWGTKTAKFENQTCKNQHWKGNRGFPGGDVHVIKPRGAEISGNTPEISSDKTSEDLDVI